MKVSGCLIIIILKNKQLDIVLPCYNPRGEWIEEILKAYRFLSTALPETDLRIILVNDGSPLSPDPEEIDTLQQNIPSFDYISYPENQGKGYALRKGVAQSKGDICIYTDLDFPYTGESLVFLYRQLLQGEHDVVVGIKDESYYEKLPPFRVKVSRFLRFLIRTFLRLSISDTQCGLKGFNKKGREIFLKTTINRYLCDLEFIFLTERAPDIQMNPLQIQLREGVEFSKVDLRILAREGFNFAAIFLRSLLGKG